jgi:hypothetical protein
VRTLRVLVGCECSGRVRDAFDKLGWEAWSADLLPSESKPVRTCYPEPGRWHHYGSGGHGFHYQGDVRDLFNWNHPVNDNRSQEQRFSPIQEHIPLWDLFIGHPPCDHLSYAGARWFKVKQADGRQQAGADFFMEMVNAPSPMVAVENPHSIMQKLYRPPAQVVQPWMFGDPYVKGIHLWLKGLPRLIPVCREDDFPQLFRTATGGGSWRTDTAAGRNLMSAHEDSEGRRNRAKVRSRTFPGLAEAMAAQWGAYARGYYGGR